MSVFTINENTSYTAMHMKEDLAQKEESRRVQYRSLDNLCDNTLSLFSGDDLNTVDLPPPPPPAESVRSDATVTDSLYLYTWLQHPYVDPDAADELQDGVDVEEEELTEEQVEEIETEVGVEEKEDVGSTRSHPGASTRREDSKRPFLLRWCFGVNIETTINLTTRKKTKIFFADSHIGVLYDYTKKSMNFLEGHRNLIADVAADVTGKWIATTDIGKDSTIIVWDTEEMKCIHTIFDAYENTASARCVGLSSCGKYLATVSDHKDPVIKFWLWTYGDDDEHDKILAKANYGTPLKIGFNPNVSEHIFVAFSRRVIFAVWDSKEKKLAEYIAPKIKNLKQSGEITDCTFVENCREVVASTAEGCIMIFGTTLYFQPFDPKTVDNKKFYVKIVRVHKYRINCITSVDSLIITGDENGHINFYDMRVRLLYWITDFGFESIRSIGFNKQQRLVKIENPFNMENKYFTVDKILEDTFEDRSEEYEVFFLGNVPMDAKINSEPFIVRNFIIVTYDGNVTMVDYVNKITTGMFYKTDCRVASIDTHDESSYICIAYANCTINLIDYVKKDLIVTNRLPMKYTGDPDDLKLVEITYIKYSPNSLYLACGKADGELLFLDPILLQPKMKFHFAKSSIVKICWSMDYQFLAYYDVCHTTCMMKFENNKWEFCGKSRFHYSTICDMAFSSDMPSRLYTISDDRCLVEYDIPNSGAGIIRTLDRERIEQISIPNSIVFYPKSDDTTERYIFMADKQQKLKRINENTKICRSVVQGPSAGCYGESPIYKMEILRENNNKYMIFATEKHIGIQMLPADGNPFKYIGSTGHPKKLLDFCTSFDKRFIFTCGMDDSCVLMWEINTSSVEIMYKSGGDELKPFYCLIEGGASGWLFKEMQDLFYYMQILHNGENSMRPRQISDRIPVMEIPDLMRAIGFYPTEYEIETILIDVKYRDYDQTKKLRDSLSFVDFVKLYINHRPPHGVATHILKDHFGKLCRLVEDDDSATSMSRENFVEIICDVGELFTRISANKCLSVLMHFKHENGFDVEYFEYLPKRIDFDTLMDDVLGIETSDQPIHKCLSG